jgi:mevalonate kinase
MMDEDKTKEQLIAELVELRKRVAELEMAEAERAGLKEKSSMRIGEILMEMGYLTKLQLERTLRKQEAEALSHMLNSKQKRLGEILVDSGIITVEQLQTGLAEQKRRLGHPNRKD